MNHNIFITVARSYSFDSWQLQFWDIIAIRLESITYWFLRIIFNFYHYLVAIVLIAGSYSFGISSQLGSKVPHTDSYVLFLIFITI